MPRRSGRARNSKYRTHILIIICIEGRIILVKELKIDVFYEWSDTGPTSPLIIESQCFTVQVECASGDVYHLAVWTDEYLTRIREQARLSGACLAGGYTGLTHYNFRATAPFWW